MCNGEKHLAFSVGVAVVDQLSISICLLISVNQTDPRHASDSPMDLRLARPTLHNADWSSCGVLRQLRRPTALRLQYKYQMWGGVRRVGGGVGGRAIFADYLSAASSASNLRSSEYRGWLKWYRNIWTCRPSSECAETVESANWITSNIVKPCSCVWWIVWNLNGA